MTNDAKTGTVDINGTKLYYELRGRGPSLFFIPGAEGDAEEYLRVVERLDNDFTVLSYDRRAYSRSPRPAGYTGSTVDVEAGDAAALLRALELAPAIVWGNSSGAIIGLSLVLRHPEVVRKAMLHEPPLFAGLSDSDHVLDFLKKATANGKAPFLRMLTGDAVYNGFSEGYDRTNLSHAQERRGPGSASDPFSLDGRVSRHGRFLDASAIVLPPDDGGIRECHPRGPAS